MSPTLAHITGKYDRAIHDMVMGGVSRDLTTSPTVRGRRQGSSASAIMMIINNKVVTPTISKNLLYNYSAHDRHQQRFSRSRVR
jgi:hypothetical protein